MVAKLTIWSILSALGPKYYKMMAFQVSSSTPFRFSAFQASFNDPLRGFGAFLVSFNEPLRGFWTFQVSFNDPLRGLTAFQVSFNDPLRGFEAFQASFNDPPPREPSSGSLQPTPPKGWSFKQPLRGGVTTCEDGLSPKGLVEIKPLRRRTLHVRYFCAPLQKPSEGLVEGHEGLGGVG